MPPLSLWLWLVGSLIGLLILERWIQRYLQGIGLLLVGDVELALIIYSLVMLPGVALHEISHWLAATLLGVRAGRFSLLPQMTADGKLQLGYVETEVVDVFREAAIGVAPLVVGATAVVGISYYFLNLGPLTEALAQGELAAAVGAVYQLRHSRDLWLWLYFIFAISNSMLPSASDRRAWLPVLALVGLALGLLFYLGWESVIIAYLARPLEVGIRTLAMAFSITVGLDLVLLPPLWLTEMGISFLTGRRLDSVGPGGH